MPDETNTLTPKERSARGKAVAENHRLRGDSDLTVATKIAAALREGCDPTLTNSTWDGLFYVLGRQDKRETRLKPSLRPKRRTTKAAKRGAKRAGARRR